MSRKIWRERQWLKYNGLIASILVSKSMLPLMIGNPMNLLSMQTRKIKKIKICFWVFLGLITQSASAQLFIYDAQDSSKIPFAFISSSSKEIYAFTDSTGKIDVIANLIGDTLNISAYGYRDTTLILSHTKTDVFLRLQSILLNEAPVNLNHQGKSFFGSKRHTTKVSTVEGFEFAREIKLKEENYPIKLKKIKIKISNTQNNIIRLKLYSKKDELPFQALNKEVIILEDQATKIKTVDVEALDIYLWDDFFVSVEFVASTPETPREEKCQLYLSSQGEANTYFRPNQSYGWTKVDSNFALCELLGEEKLNLIVQVVYDY